MVGSNSYNTAYNFRTHFTILRQNKHTNQQETTEKRRVNHGNTVPNNRSNTNLRHNNINVNSDHKLSAGSRKHLHTFDLHTQSFRKPRF